MCIKESLAPGPLYVKMCSFLHTRVYSNKLISFDLYQTTSALDQHIFVNEKLSFLTNECIKLQLWKALLIDVIQIQKLLFVTPFFWFFFYLIGLSFTNSQLLYHQAHMGPNFSTWITSGKSFILLDSETLPKKELTLCSKHWNHYTPM